MSNKLKIKQLEQKIAIYEAAINMLDEEQKKYLKTLIKHIEYNIEQNNYKYYIK